MLMNNNINHDILLIELMQKMYSDRGCEMYHILRFLLKNPFIIKLIHIDKIHF